MRSCGSTPLFFDFDMVPMPSASTGLPSERSTAPVRCPLSRSEEHTSELQSQSNLVCRLVLEKKKTCVRMGNDIFTSPDFPAEIRAPAGTRAGVSGYQLFFFNDTATTEIYTLSLHDALPISRQVIFLPSAYVRPLYEMGSSQMR